MTTPALPTTWQVTSTSETTDLDAASKFVKGILVTFTTSRGHSGDVFVPLSGATPENVRAIIQARVDQLERINSLTGGGE